VETRVKQNKTKVMKVKKGLLGRWIEKGKGKVSGGGE
jgi:hypothetical protein